MFKYNEWSDLKNSNSLVKPILKEEDGRVLCINENGEECYYVFDDFDLKKKPEDRTTSTIEEIIQGLGDEPEPEPEPDIKDDSKNDGTELPKEEENEIEEYEDTPEGFYYEDKYLKLLNLKKGIFYKDNI